MCLAAFLGGIFIGTSVNSKKYQDGRVSGCNDIVKNLPAGAEGIAVCVPYEGDVALKITMGDKTQLFTLDGKPLN
jgi:hypothetical protein